MPSKRPDSITGTLAVSARHRQQGATVVEFAAVAALVLIIVFGILEFGLVFLQEHFVANAAREGARVGVLANNFDCYDGYDIANNPCPSGHPEKDRKARTEAAVRAYLSDLMPYGQDDISVETCSYLKDDRPYYEVNVEARNFSPSLIRGLLKIFDQSEITKIDIIAFRVTMEYEDKDEFISDRNSKTYCSGRSS